MVGIVRFVFAKVRGVRPFVVVYGPHERRRARPQLAAQRERVRAEFDFVIRREYGIFIKVAVFEPAHVRRPYSVFKLHRRYAAFPSIEIPNDRYGFCVWRPDHKTMASRFGMAAHEFVSIGALAREEAQDILLI
ncbi:hypothetical protein SDC9_176212 [bioreactor metagenome]|uniref:Uncharacterized protein n=1 Tax=bioreactor metagenome TaxID=1076179 RepID=A0A645GPH8_9ZZZZ